MIKDAIAPSRVLTVRSRSLAGALTELVGYTEKESLGSSAFIRLMGAPVMGGYSLSVEFPVPADSSPDEKQGGLK